MAKKKLFFLWLRHGATFLNGIYKFDFDGYVRGYKRYPLKWQKAVYNLYCNEIHAV